MKTFLKNQVGPFCQLNVVVQDRKVSQKRLIIID